MDFKAMDFKAMDFKAMDFKAMDFEAKDFKAMDSDTFKSSLRMWGSGVTIITTCQDDGDPAGFTASSFTSVSLDPPRVLFCLEKNSTHFAAFQKARWFAIHILGGDQEALSGRFADKNVDRFAGIDYGKGLGGVPILPGCLAAMECSSAGVYPGGDHIIIVGNVESATIQPGDPLLYFQGGYRALKE